jgi:acetoacetyl-CoA synthetase
MPTPDRAGASAGAPIWEPGPNRVARANLTRFIDDVSGRVPSAAAVTDYASLYDWSVRCPSDFWAAVWRFGSVIADRDAQGEQWREVLVGGERMAPPDPTLGPTWFAGARLNFAENLLRFRDDRVALIAWSELGAGTARRMTFAELSVEVARVAGALRARGVVPGDRVAGFLPNVAEAVIAMLATASIGAVWSSCSPDFGAAGVVDRFGQIRPRVLFCADGYRYGGKEIDLTDRVRGVLDAIPGIEHVIVVPCLKEAPPTPISRAETWAAFAASGAGVPLEFARLPFDHPLYIVYSSGTTGLPKCMVHGAGGTLLQHLKEHVLHTDLTRDDRIFYFTTCGWMMWNWLVSALAVGSAIVLYDGSPILRRRPVLWDLAAGERVTVFGTSAKWLALTEKEGANPSVSHDLSALRTILSTGSPLAPHSYDFVYSRVKPDVQLASISGGTDILSCFALGNPIAPVWRGELQARGLGMRVEVFDESGKPVVGEPGELVCAAPFPSMPVSFWNDPDGAAYRAAYFDVYPNVWRHGDWAELTPRGGMIIHGRSDATLNPGGVRIGTAEIYRQVEQLPEIVESVVIGQRVNGAAGEDVRIVLFIRLAEGVALDDALRSRIRERIRAHASPHHVPKKILAVADIPRTISGKITELAVRDVVEGRTVKNVDALANPAALELFRNLPELRD